MRHEDRGASADLMFFIGLLLLSALVFAVFVDSKIQTQLSQFVVYDAGVRTALAAERVGAPSARVQGAEGCLSSSFKTTHVTTAA